MGSYNYGKPEVCEWVRRNFATDATLLDIGACDGKWKMLLPEYWNFDAVEAWEPNLRRLQAYRCVYHADIRDLKYDWYDLLIFGDIIEHLPVEDAQAVLEYAKPRCRDMIIAVPYLYKQDAIEGNTYEIHVQDDLTAEIFDQRYPGFEILCKPIQEYCYYHKAGGLQ